MSGHVYYKAIPGVEFYTGSLGHGLTVACGIAHGYKLDNLNNKVVCLLSDGECDEGSNWEAIMLAGHLKLENLTIFIDINELGQVGKLENSCSLEPLAQKFESFNFDVFDIDGHDEEKLDLAIKKSFISKKPTAILCRTVKGYGISFMEKNKLWHYKCPKGDDY